MRNPLYVAGRALQLLGLLVMPSAIWTAEVYHSEAMSVGILVAALLAFGIGYLLTQGAAKL